jgi:hypothetical protein
MLVDPHFGGLVGMELGRIPTTGLQVPRALVERFDPVRVEALAERLGEENVRKPSQLDRVVVLLSGLELADT